METLVHESIYEAMRATIHASGGAKSVGITLWPEKSADKAGELISNCLNVDRPEKFSPEQMVFIMREGQKIGSHFMAEYLGTECSYKFEPIQPLNEMAELMKQFNASVAVQAQIVERLEALKK